MKTITPTVDLLAAGLLPTGTDAPLFIDDAEWKQLSKEELLNIARLHIFDTGVIRDCASDLAQLNMAYGLAKIHYVQKLLGFSMPYASVIWSSDRTITKNIERWQAGFGYGGKITWGQGTEEIIFLEGMPNACGTIVVGLDKLPPLHALFNRFKHLLSKKTIICGQEVIWDFGKGNHFVNVFKTEVLLPRVSLPKYVGIIHMGCDAQKKEVYWFLFDDVWRKEVKEFETPFGRTFVLIGKVAREYYQRYLDVEHYAKEKRKYAVRKIFHSDHIISESTHQGLIDMNNLVLGANYFALADIHKLYPITLRSDLPAFLVYPKPNLSSQGIDALNLTKRAKKVGCYERLLSANIFPHGAGYRLLHKLNVIGVESINGYRLFRLQNESSYNEEIVAHLKGMDTDYRGVEVASAAFVQGMCRPAVKLLPVYTIRT